LSPYPDGGGAVHRPPGNSELKAEIEHEMQTFAATDPETLDTTLLIHPAVMGDFLDFHFLPAEADAAIRRLELDGIIQMASLHPHYEFANSDPRHRQLHQPRALSDPAPAARSEHRPRRGGL
jgi:hypothetical protein